MMTKDPGQRVVIIGGGVIGAMSAWYLGEAGFRITIVDRDRFGSGCSHGNCGYVCPSHVLPLARPGAISSTLRALLRPNSPLRIKPRWSSSLFRWFLNFAGRCNHDDMLSAAIGRHALLQSSKQLYKTLIADEQIACEWQSRGLLFVYDTQRQWNEFRHTNDLVSRHFGVRATPYESHALVELEPALKPGLGGGWHYEADCHLRPDKLMSALRERLEDRGVSIVERFTVQRFVVEGDKVKAIEGSGETIEADALVVATGALTPMLNQHLGCQIPIEPGKGYSLTMAAPQRMPRMPIIFEQSHVAVTPMQTKYRIGSTLEFVGYDTSIHAKRIGLLRTAAERYLHEPYCEPIEEEWFGWRPMIWDGKPIIDRSPALSNVWIAAGHGMLGLSMATGTGRLVSELIRGEPPHIDPSHFAISRF